MWTDDDVKNGLAAAAAVLVAVGLAAAAVAAFDYLEQQHHERFMECASKHGAEACR